MGRKGDWVHLTFLSLAMKALASVAREGGFLGYPSRTTWTWRGKLPKEIVCFKKKGEAWQIKTEVTMESLRVDLRRCLGWGWGLAGNIKLSNAAQGIWPEMRKQGLFTGSSRQAKD